MSAKVISSLTGRKCTVDFYPNGFRWDTLTDFLEQRGRLRLPEREYKRCYICGRYLGKRRRPVTISVHGIGTRFCCDYCKARYGNGKDDEMSGVSQEAEKPDECGEWNRAGML